TEKGRSAGLHDPAHRAAANAARTGIAFMAIDCPAVLEIPELSVGLDVIAQRGPAGFDRLGQDRANPNDQPLRTPPADRGREASRRDARAEERLANIDVSEPGDDPLIEQRGFDRRHLAGERRSEIGAVEFGFERLRAEPRQERVLFLLAALDVVEQPEAAGIVEADDGTVVEPQHDMV